MTLSPEISMSGTSCSLRTPMCCGSTLETRMYGTGKTKARDVIARIIEMAEKVQS